MMTINVNRFFCVCLVMLAIVPAIFCVLGFISVEGEMENAIMEAMIVALAVSYYCMFPRLRSFFRSLWLNEGRWL